VERFEELEEHRAGRPKILKVLVHFTGLHVPNNSLTTITLPPFQETMPVAQRYSVAPRTRPSEYGISYRLADWTIIWRRGGSLLRRALAWVSRASMGKSVLLFYLHKK
jgi:hypothetical protein